MPSGLKQASEPKEKGYKICPESIRGFNGKDYRIDFEGGSSN